MFRVVVPAAALAAAAAAARKGGLPQTVEFDSFAVAHGVWLITPEFCLHVVALARSIIILELLGLRQNSQHNKFRIAHEQPSMPHHVSPHSRRQRRGSCFPRVVLTRSLPAAKAWLQEEGRVLQTC
jgi:hypothetical protein